MNDASSFKHKDNEHASALRVLIVDDSVTLAQTFGWMVECLGHDFRLAHDGPSALEAARSFLPDIMFIDISLPGMNGYEVAAAIRQEKALKHCVLVAQTGWSKHDQGNRYKESGFDHFLYKPVTLETLDSVLSSVQPLAVEAL